MNKSAMCLLLSSSFLASCSVNVDQYEDSDNNFDLQSYFDGKLIAWGVIQNLNDKVTRKFCVELDGQWENKKGLLAEKFYFDDGEISYRNWHLTETTPNHFTGTAEDVVGTAIGQQQGMAFNLQYTLKLPVDDTTYEVAMDDWMYQIDEYRIVNKTSISKLSVNVANVTIFFDKQLPLNTCLDFNNR